MTAAASLSGGRRGSITLLLRLSDAIAAILLAADLVVVCVSVLLRFLFNAPVEWSDDVARGLMVGSAFLVRRARLRAARMSACPSSATC